MLKGVKGTGKTQKKRKDTASATTRAQCSACSNTRTTNRCGQRKKTNTHRALCRTMRSLCCYPLALSGCARLSGKLSSCPRKEKLLTLRPTPWRHATIELHEEFGIRLMAVLIKVEVRELSIYLILGSKVLVEANKALFSVFEGRDYRLSEGSV